MNILIADKVSPKMIADLQGLGADVVSMPDIKPDELPGVIGNAKVLIVRSKKVTADTIHAGHNLSLIVRAGAGVNTIDLDAASRSGTYVANCPGKNTDAVAELVIGLMIACDRGIVDATLALRQGAWEKKRFGAGAGLKGRTLGIIGTGAIGMAVARRAQGLDMNIIAWSRSLTPETAKSLDMEFAATPLDVAVKADVVSVHVAAAPETKGMINETFFAAMKEGAIFINASRGDIVDHDALLVAIDRKGVKAGLDVFAGEPSGGQAAFDQTELAGKVVCTPHIGASTAQAEEAIAAEAVRVVKEFTRTGSPPNVVNVRTAPGAGATLVVRHYNRVGVLAGVLNLLRDEGINIEEMQNLIFAHSEAASCTIMVDRKPTSRLVAQIEQSNDIIEVVAE
ncbi:MAG: NAD(P)-dependent oxidoreductase [Lentisphaeria bacterium]|nr:NAD(P)-dependent oxidoreductase [Lentisphaeria bacterium]